MRSIANSMFVLSLFLLSTGLTQAADFCVTPDVLGAIAHAELVFSGRIIKLTPMVAQPGEPYITYIVSFEVEKWWKGKKSREVRVVWSSSTIDCEYLPVGKIGERYLVYADPPSNNQVAKEMLPEVTALNRTSRLELRAGLVDDSSSKIGPRRLVNSKPPLDRADALNDIKVLDVMIECECLSTNSGSVCMDLPLSSLRTPTDLSVSSQVSRCCKCLREQLRLF